VAEIQHAGELVMAYVWHMYGSVPGMRLCLKRASEGGGVWCAMLHASVHVGACAVASRYVQSMWVVTR
jgi:hypothetical protein